MFMCYMVDDEVNDGAVSCPANLQKAIEAVKGKKKWSDILFVNIFIFLDKFNTQK